MTEGRDLCWTVNIIRKRSDIGLELYIGEYYKPIWHFYRKYDYGERKLILRVAFEKYLLHHPELRRRG